MPNERLRAALLQRGFTPAALGEELGVDHKTVERWLGGRVPYRRHRYAVASRLQLDEAYLWPGALSREQVAAASDSEVLAIYPHRSDVPRDVWERLFGPAERDIGVLVYSGLALAEDTGVQKILAERARAGAAARRRARRDQKSFRFSRPSRSYWVASRSVIRNPLSTKNTSTPRKPPVSSDAPSWKPMTASTASARTPSSPGARLGEFVVVVSVPPA